MNLLLVAESERKDSYASANCQKSWIAQPFVQAGFKAVEKWEFSPALLRKTNLMRAVLSLRGHPISIYFRPAAIALVSDPLVSSSFNAHTYAPPSLFFLMYAVFAATAAESS